MDRKQRMNDLINELVTKKTTNKIAMLLELMADSLKQKEENHHSKI